MPEMLNCGSFILVRTFISLSCVRMLRVNVLPLRPLCGMAHPEVWCPEAGWQTGVCTFRMVTQRLASQVSVPTANMEEIIPAARLLSRATALTHSDYERAKSAFLSGMDASGLAAQVRRRTQGILVRVG